MNKLRRTYFLTATLVIIQLTGCMNAGMNNKNTQTPIRPYKQNPRYWEYHGNPVLLLGGSKNDNLFQCTGLKAHLDTMHKIGANYVRNTMSSRDSGNLWPFHQLDNGKYDLTKMNGGYWDKFEHFLKMTHKKEIFVQIEVWDRFDYSRDPWQKNPFNPKNNINYTAEETPLDTIYPKHPYNDLQPFFHTIRGMAKYNDSLDIIRKFQEKRVDKMLEYALQYGHVLYCMNNETSTSPRWGEYWINYINDKAKAKGIDVYTTDMYDHFFKPSACKPCQRLISKPNTFEFIDYSQINSRNFGQDHWDTMQIILEKREQYKLRPANNTKIYGGAQSSWGSGTNQDGVERFCRNIIGGSASARHHRPDHGNGLNVKAKASIKAMRKVEKLVKMWDVSPAMKLLGEREPNEAYVAANNGEQYVVYFPKDASVLLDLSKYKNTFSLQWINVKTGKWGEEKTIEGGESVPLKTPDDSGWFVGIKVVD